MLFRSGGRKGQSECLQRILGRPTEQPCEPTVAANPHFPIGLTLAQPYLRNEDAATQMDFWPICAVRRLGAMPMMIGFTTHLFPAPCHGDDGESGAVWQTLVSQGGATLDIQCATDVHRGGTSLRYKGKSQQTVNRCHCPLPSDNL